MTELPNILQHPQSTYLIMVREDLIRICDDAPDPQCAGVILALFEYWMRVKKANQPQAQIENSIAVKGGAKPTQDDSLWVWKTEEQLKKETFNIYGIKKLRLHREWLVNAGFLLKRKNPKYGWDQTLQYQLNIGAIQTALDVWQGCRVDAAELPDGPAELPDESGQTAAAIPETTSETTKKTTKKNKSAARSRPADFSSVVDMFAGHSVDAAEDGYVLSNGEEPESRTFTALETFIMSKTGGHQMAQWMCDVLNSPSKSDKQPANDSLPSPNSLYDEHEDYQTWVQVAVMDWAFTPSEKRGDPLPREAIVRAVRAGYDWYQDYARDLYAKRLLKGGGFTITEWYGDEDDLPDFNPTD